MIKGLKTAQDLENLRGLGRLSLPKTRLQGGVTTVCRNLQKNQEFDKAGARR